MIRDNKGKFESKNKRAWKYIAVLWILVGILYIFVTVLEKYNEWSYTFRWWVDANPLEIQEDWAFWNVVKREPLTVISPMAEEVFTEYEELTDVETLILEKWGPYEAKVAIAVARTESGLNPEALHYNTNGTYDVGVFQINSIHWEKCGGLKTLLDVQGNIDCAYNIWSEQGWNPWVVFNTGAFKSSL